MGAPMCVLACGGDGDGGVGGAGEERESLIARVTAECETNA